MNETPSGGLDASDAITEAGRVLKESKSYPISLSSYSANYWSLWVDKLDANRGMAFETISENSDKGTRDDDMRAVVASIFRTALRHSNITGEDITLLLNVQQVNFLINTNMECYLAQSSANEFKNSEARSTELRSIFNKAKKQTEPGVFQKAQQAMNKLFHPKPKNP